MWLLSTERAELHHFASPEAVQDGYAILSHVWRQHEQTFQDVCEIERRCAISGENPRDLMGNKIRLCCQLAQQHGYKWVWIDTCCIDKTSSAELSEAINSMFSYYALSDICYAYLHDMPEDAHVDEDGFFDDSKWHTRGWTLQELLAPRVVLFLSRPWKPMGTKGDFAHVLQAVTKIPASLLRLECGISDFSVAQRMSWAATRETTRIEDRAYSLLGIFDINMPTLYGEGVKAFQRLQEEIMRRSPDTTLFAWGTSVTVKVSWHAFVKTYREISDSLRRASTPEVSDQAYTLAPSPEAFEGCQDVVARGRPAQPAVERVTRPSERSLPSFSVTPHGVLAWLPIVERDEHAFVDFHWTKASGSDAAERHLLWLLCKSQDSPDPSRPLYHNSMALSSHLNGRLAEMSSKHYTATVAVSKPVWREIYLALRPSPSLSASRPAVIPSNNSLFTPFRLPERQIARLLRKFMSVKLVEVRSPGPWAAASKPARFVFQSQSDAPRLVIQVGHCDRQRRISGTKRSTPNSPTASTSPKALWASLHVLASPADPVPEQSCADDHVQGWRKMKRTFEFSDTLSRSPIPFRELEPDQGTVAVTLAFIPCPINPESLVLHIHARATDAGAGAGDGGSLVLGRWRFKPSGGSIPLARTQASTPLPE